MKAHPRFGPRDNYRGRRVEAKRASAEVSGGLVRRRRRGGVTADCSSRVNKKGGEGWGGAERGAIRDMEGAGRRGERGRGGGGITAEAFH